MISVEEKGSTSSAANQQSTDCMLVRHRVTHFVRVNKISRAAVKIGTIGQIVRQCPVYDWLERGVLFASYENRCNYDVKLMKEL